VIEDMTSTAQVRPAPAGPAQPDNLAELHAALVDEVHKVLSSDGWRAWLRTAARFHQYSFLNTLLIHAQRPDATHVAGYRVWQSLGRQVDKGQRGIRILAPIVRRIEIDQQQQVQAPPPDTPAQPGPARTVVGFRPAYVWDVAQTSGKLLAAPPPRAPAVTGQAPAGLWDALAAEVARAGFGLREQTLPGTMDGLTDFAARVVTIDPEPDDAHRAVTLAHELAHVRLHDPFAASTDAMPTSERVATGNCRGDQEVEAESVALTWWPRCMGSTPPTTPSTTWPGGRRARLTTSLMSRNGSGLEWCAPHMPSLIGSARPKRPTATSTCAQPEACRSIVLSACASRL
jgi:hypothetical protein